MIVEDIGVEDCANRDGDKNDDSSTRVEVEDASEDEGGVDDDDDGVNARVGASAPFDVDIPGDTRSSDGASSVGDTHISGMRTAAIATASNECEGGQEAVETATAPEARPSVEEAGGTYSVTISIEQSNGSSHEARLRFPKHENSRP